MKPDATASQVLVDEVDMNKIHVYLNIMDT